MRISGNSLGFIAASSASFAAGSSSLDTPIPLIHFLYAGPYEDRISTGSIATIETILTYVNNSTGSRGGATGALSFKLSDPATLNTTGSEVMRMFITSSEPRVGIGFDRDESPLTVFEVKSKKDSSEGTELLLRSSRTTKGAEVGDSAGTINFIIDSGSYSPADKTKFIASGSIASITTKVVAINESGVRGHLKINAARANTDASRALWTMGYAADPRVAGNFGSITTGSLNIVRPNSVLDDMLTLTNYNGDYISLLYHSSSISTDAETTVDSFTTGSYTGVTYDYTLTKPSTGARTGQVMAIWDAGEIEMTDVSTPALGSGGTPTLTVTLEGVNNNVFTLKITNGNGYTFKSFVKRI